MYDQTDAVCGFLLEAITDEDGRVRPSAKRALKSTVRTYDALEEAETNAAIIEELERMAANDSGKQRKHLLEAKEDAEFFMHSGIGRMVKVSRRSSAMNQIPDRIMRVPMRPLPTHLSVAHVAQ